MGGVLPDNLLPDTSTDLGCQLARYTQSADTEWEDHGIHKGLQIVDFSAKFQPL